ncbi:ubiquitin-ribosomal protein eL40 fusion protein-like isoform X1 [Corticium candelabrum]|uniref:ubiquitin-ribosomal protein eL40 fusion protein-like isoform X1 n=1 Tax=Corticium candelabrum TaxID=121492 RepID=UPI002E270DE7|nr:ubiquitin-ribosomal protein eL40 fusion protein-like isoform X1 [Corticium candelabrum]
MTHMQRLKYCKSKSALAKKATHENVTKLPANHQRASESEWLKLVAKSLNGKEVQLKAKASDTIATLKKQLGSKDDSSSMDQLLVVNGKQLRDEQTYSDAGLCLVPM